MNRRCEGRKRVVASLIERSVGVRPSFEDKHQFRNAIHLDRGRFSLFAVPHVADSTSRAGRVRDRPG